MKKLLLILQIISVSLLASCGGGKTAVVTFPVPVEVSKVKSLEYINNSFTGVVKSVQTSNLAFKTGGQLIKLSVEEGDKVTKGQFIAEVDPIDYKLKLEAAKAAYIKSKSQLERFTRLIERDAISKQEFEGVQAAYANDKANYENAVSMVGETKIYAPFSGIIEKRFVENFQRVQPTEPIVSLINPNDVEMRFTLSESMFPLMGVPEKSFFVKFEAYPSYKFKAKLTKFVNSSTGGGFPVTVQIDDPTFSITKFNIKPGFSCTVYIEVHNADMKNLVAVPATSVASDMSSNQDYVWIYDPATEVVTKKNVTVGGLYGTSDIIITSGLTSSEEVVTAGVYSLQNGQKVKALKK